MAANYPDWVLAQKRSGTAIHHIKGHYYLYEVRSVWDSEKKRPKRVTGKSLGRITPDGLIASVPRTRNPEGDIGGAHSGLSARDLARIGHISVKEHGVSHWLQTQQADCWKRLETAFGAHWPVLVGVAYCRLVHQSSLRQMPLHLAGSYLSEILAQAEPKSPAAPWSARYISGVLAEIGRNRPAISAFMRQSIPAGEHLLIDMTNIPSQSTQIPLCKPGYNSAWDFEPQFNLLYLYSRTLQMPVFYRLLPGNIREVSALKLTVQESGLKDALLVGDKGFFSKANIQELDKQNLTYIIPLRRNNPLIDFTKMAEADLKSGESFFRHEKRYIWHTHYALQDATTGQPTGKTLYLYLDDALKTKEQADYLTRIENKIEGYSIAAFHERKHRFGSIALLSNIEHTNQSPHYIFTTYKSRMAIENAFDALKTVLEADKTYMQNEDVLHGWIFANHLALQWYFQLANLLAYHKLTAQFSVADIIQHMVGVRILRIQDKWIPAEVIKATREIISKIERPIA